MSADNYKAARAEVLAKKPPRCPVCGSPPSEVDEVEMPSDGMFRRYEMRYTCPNITRADHHKVAP